MKAVGAAFVAGLLGVLIGSLAAQGPEDVVRPGEAVDRFLYEGEIELLAFGERENVDRGIVRVYPDWVLHVEERRFIPREQVQQLKFRAPEGAGRDFGADPEGGRPARPDRFRAD